MDEGKENNQNDPALILFLNAGTESDEQVALAELVRTNVEPVITRVLRSKLHVSAAPERFDPVGQDAAELLAEIRLKIISEFKKFKANGNGKVIHNLESYSAAVTTNAFREYLRQKYPRREQLRNKLRYLLTHHNSFAMWKDESSDMWLSGLRRDNGAVRCPPKDIQELRVIADQVSREKSFKQLQIIELLIKIFNLAGCPIKFSDLITVVAEVLGIRDLERVPEADSSSSLERLAGADDLIAQRLEHKEILSAAWQEICSLPVRHRLALLLNLKDRSGDCMVSQFPLLRVASVRTIAEILEFSPEEFAVVWNELPWDDSKIAEYMGLTRQQVINLRQSARARLVRRINF